MDEKTRRIVKVFIAGFFLAIITNTIAFLVVWLTGGFRQDCTSSPGILSDCIAAGMCSLVRMAYNIFLSMLLVDCAIGVLLFLYSLTRSGKSKETFKFWAISFIVAGAFSLIFKVLTLPALSWLSNMPLYC